MIGKIWIGLTLALLLNSCETAPEKPDCIAASNYRGQRTMSCNPTPDRKRALRRDDVYIPPATRAQDKR